MTTLLAKIGRFLSTGLWQIRLNELPTPKSFAIRQLRVLVLAVREFDEDRCQLRASALTFYTLLSIVPIFAMAFGVAKGFGFEDRLKDEIRSAFPKQVVVVAEDPEPDDLHLDGVAPDEETEGDLASGAGPSGEADRNVESDGDADGNGGADAEPPESPETLPGAPPETSDETATETSDEAATDTIETASSGEGGDTMEPLAAPPVDLVDGMIGFAENLLANTNGGVITGIGLIVLFWTVIRVLGNIEHSFNDIWGVKKPRTLARKLGDYLAVMMVAPILVIASGGINVAITSQMDAIMEKSGLFEFAATVVSWGLKIIPYTILWGLFTFIYMFVPNLKVRMSSGIVAGIVAGTMYQLVQWGYIVFQIGVSKYNAIYGSFAALPLFLVWLQISWTVVLFGAELAFAHQNVDTFELEPDVKGASPTLRRLIALRIVHVCVLRFVEGGEARVASQIAKELNVPARLVRDLVNRLVQSHVLSETPGRGIREPGYQPARDVASLTVSSVINSLDDFGTGGLTGGDSAEMERLAGALESFRVACDASDGNLLLRDL